MDTPVSLDLALRQHQAVLRVIEEMMYSGSEWDVVIGSESFPSQISVLSGGNGMRASALVNRPCSGTVVIRQKGDDFGPVLVHPDPWVQDRPARLEWDLVMSYDPVKA